MKSPLHFSFPVLTVSFLSLSLLVGCTRQPEPKPEPEAVAPSTSPSGPAKAPSNKSLPAPTPETPAKPTVEKPILVTAADLVKAFNSDRATAAQRYQGKTIYVEGIVSVTELPEEGIGGSVTLEGLPPEEIEPGKVKDVLCNLRYGSQASRVQESQPVKVQGVCEGVNFQQAVTLSNASLVEIRRIPADVVKQKEEAEKALALLKGLGVGYTDAAGGFWEIYLRPEHVAANGQLRPEVLAALLKIPRLRGISVELAPLTDAGLEGLKEFTKLAKLSLEGTQITDAGLAQLKALTRLRSLDLASTQITNAALDQLQGLKYLDSLGLASTQINDAGLAQLKLLPRLRSLYLTDTAVSDVGLEQLTALPALTELGLAKTKITDAGLTYLMGLKNLKLLSVSKKGVTMAAVNQLKEALPNLEVKFID
jgi:hypothetical protein